MDSFRSYSRIRKVLRVLFWVLVVVAVLSYFKKDDLPPPSVLSYELDRTPIQEPVDKEPFTVTADGNTYTITPLYSYDLVGLVVSEHDADSWFDYYHDRWNDTINVKDLCVVWGENAMSGIYKEFSFKNGSFTCYYRTESTPAFRAFNSNEISNNHLLSISEDVRQTLASIGPGDQVRFTGYLASYEQDNGFKRGTSIRRDDAGNGACETVFLTNIEIIERAHPFARTLHLVSFYGLIVAGLLRVLFAGIYTSHHLRRNTKKEV